MLSELGADVILMDLQYVPALLTPVSTKQAEERMVDLIASAAERAAYPVNVFRRYDMMRRWHQVEHASFDRILNPTDGDRSSSQRLERAPDGRSTRRHDRDRRRSHCLRPSPYRAPTNEPRTASCRDWPPLYPF
jgi:hypothetical protein